MFLYFTKDLTSNCLDNKICNAILQIFNNSTFKVERFYGKVRFPFYFICDNAKIH